jgi:SAM-dependent methyltransferase
LRNKTDFNFGANWESYSKKVIDAGRLTVAAASLGELVGADRLRGRSFLDVGSGTGMFSIAAAQLDASETLGLDVNPTCVEVAKRNAANFIRVGKRPGFELISILEGQKIEALGLFDIVYAWGSLHHTGRMHDAIRNAAGRVKPGGTFVLAIYNRHWTSGTWKVIKIVYNLSPKWLQKVWAGLFSGVIFLAKFAVTGKNPLKMERGMDFYHDVVDWIGGYPYEYASISEIKAFVEPLGFKTLRVIPAKVPTGCNEFVFEKCS